MRKVIAIVIFIAAGSLVASPAASAGTDDADSSGCILSQEPDIVCTFPDLTIELNWEEEEICANGTGECVDEGLLVTIKLDDYCISFEDLAELISGDEDGGNGEGNGNGNQQG